MPLLPFSIDGLLDGWIGHGALPLGLPWLAGALLALRHRRPWLAVVFTLLLAALAVSLFPGLAWLDAAVRGGQALVLVALVLGSGRRGAGPPGLASFALLLLLCREPDALVLVVVLASRSLLERGAPARGWLVAALSLLWLASLLQDELLWVWRAVTWLSGLGADAASLLARVLVEAVRLGGWATFLRWGFPPRRG